MSIQKSIVGKTPSGESVTEYTLTNSKGAYVSVLDFGGVVTKIVVPDRDGKLGDVNLGFDDPARYAADSGSMGAIIGRVGNRIGGAEFELEGKTYKLFKNNGEANLHGGPVGFNVRMWQAEESTVDGAPAVKLTLVSEDGDQGFPGRLTTTVTYYFNDDCELGMHYHATTDKPTLVNLTNHCYFNLDGHETGSIEDLVLQIPAELVTDVAPGLIPTGRLNPVGETPYDFRKPTRIGDVLKHTDSDPNMKGAGGVDFNYCFGAARQTKLAATLYSPKTGRVMEVVTDQPGVQCYTGQGLHHTGKGGAKYGKYAGVCLETQCYPDGIHHPQFPTIVLRPQDVYDTLSVYRFGVR